MDTRQYLGLRKQVSVSCHRLPSPCADAVSRTVLVSVASPPSRNWSLTGGIPDSLARLTGLQNLTLSYNNLSGPVPAALNGSAIQRLWLNNQQGDAKLSGTLDVVATMTGLQELWLHDNDFSGPVPDAIAVCKELYTVRLNNNQLLGLLPPGLAALPTLRELKLDNNNLLGPVPALKLDNNNRLDASDGDMPVIAGIGTCC
jgi:Leucine-rich repeat (LRR) protein